ncbi:hypothetical protein GCM10019016_077090 [Streptomyces prasinosporus]|uniref:Uncharacterized protein n=1 Tax=Streptomyces prasinosporus TaxID=68256 RepID=A0ABP6TYY0_9ACTN|nr:hypothetical protein GCM10010332_20690 [Streptomyces albogriseolus]
MGQPRTTSGRTGEAQKETGAVAATVARPGADRLVRASPDMGLLQLPVGVARGWGPGIGASPDVPERSARVTR